MSLESLKWWHWTLITLVVVLGFKFAQLEMTGEAPPKTPMERPALSGLIPVTAATAPTVSGEYDRITIEAHLAAARPAALVDATAALVRQVAEGLQHGVREDSPAVTLVRVLVETEGLDRLGKTSRNLSLYALDFAAKDLREARLLKAPPPAFLDLASRTVFNSVLGVDVVEAWCAQAPNLRAAPRYCALAEAAERSAPAHAPR